MRRGRSKTVDVQKTVDRRRGVIVQSRTKKFYLGLAFFLILGYCYKNEKDFVKICFVRWNSAKASFAECFRIYGNSNNDVPKVILGHFLFLGEREEHYE